MEISVDNLYVDIGLIGLPENFSCPLALYYNYCGSTELFFKHLLRSLAAP